MIQTLSFVFVFAFTWSIRASSFHHHPMATINLPSLRPYPNPICASTLPAPSFSFLPSSPLALRVLLPSLPSRGLPIYLVPLLAVPRPPTRSVFAGILPATRTIIYSVLLLTLAKTSPIDLVNFYLNNRVSPKHLEAL
ncbi:hypothetical protein F4779DRAFT_158339 [Xylariaceae sp. FL0662B]|nr:hypothetical protein F4779DRAFT_158339 [Xylariaceae sp. FL0662B]